MYVQVHSNNNNYSVVSEASQIQVMAEGQTLITLKVDPRVAEIGARLCLSWTGDVTEGHWIGLFPSGNKNSSSRVNVVRITLVVICQYIMFNLLTPCPSCILQVCNTLTS